MLRRVGDRERGGGGKCNKIPEIQEIEFNNRHLYTHPQRLLFFNQIIIYFEDYFKGLEIYFRVPP